MNEIAIIIEAEINPTENPEKVKLAIENIFGAVEFEVQTRNRGSLLTARTKGTDGLTKLYNLLRRERIRDATRAVLFGGLENDSIIFYLNKQVAFAGHVSFCESTGESPLGPITVKISCDNPRALIDWLAPRTT